MSPMLDVHSFDRRLGPIVSVAVELEALQLFCDDLLQDVSVEREIGNQPLQLAIFFPQTAAIPATRLLPVAMSTNISPTLPAKVGPTWLEGKRSKLGHYGLPHEPHPSQSALEQTSADCDPSSLPKRSLRWRTSWPD